MGSVKVRNTTVNGGMTGRDKTISKVFAFRDGNTYSSMKTFTKPANPQSELQNVVRQAFTQSASGWSGLTQNERDAWEADAPNWLNTGVFGIKKMSGQNLYIGCNVALAVAGLDAITVPGSREIIGAIDSLELSFVGANLTLEGVFTGGSSLNAIEVAVSSPKSLGSSKVTKLTVLNSYPMDGDITEILNADYVAKYGSIPAGKKIFYELRYVSAGGNVSAWSFGNLLT